MCSYNAPEHYTNFFAEFPHQSAKGQDSKCAQLKLSIGIYGTNSSPGVHIHSRYRILTSRNKTYSASILNRRYSTAEQSPATNKKCSTSTSENVRLYRSLTNVSRTYCQNQKVCLIGSGNSTAYAKKVTIPQKENKKSLDCGMTRVEILKKQVASG